LRVPRPRTLSACNEGTQVPELDAAIERAAAAVGEQVRGDIGDRDHLRYRGNDYDLVEAQGRRSGFTTWRVYLYDRSAGTAERLEVVTHGAARRSPTPPRPCCATRRAAPRSW
jgi:hypothetical protein